MIEAMVVVFPVPAGPVTRIKPRRSLARRSTTGGRWRSVIAGTSEVTSRATRPIESRCEYRLMRYRPRPGNDFATSASPSARSSCSLSGGNSSSATVHMSSSVSEGKSMRISSPCERAIGGEPAFR